jgi:hypothetical protein
MERVAVPYATDSDPRLVEPSLNVTHPVAQAGERVAVKVTGEPTGDGFVSAVRTTAPSTLGRTTWLSTADVLPA